MAMAAKGMTRSFVGSELEECAKLVARRIGFAGRDVVYGAGLVACG